MSFRKFKNIEYPVPGVDTAIEVLRPGARYDISCAGGIFINEWEDDEGRTLKRLFPIQKKSEQKFFERKRFTIIMNMKEIVKNNIQV